MSNAVDPLCAPSNSDPSSDRVSLKDRVSALEGEELAFVRNLLNNPAVRYNAS